MGDIIAVARRFCKITIASAWHKKTACLEGTPSVRAVKRFFHACRAVEALPDALIFT
jgi:hypothetical protein